MDELNAMYNLEVLCNQKAPQIEALFAQYGYNAPANVDTLCSMTVLHKEPFMDDLYMATHPFNTEVGERLIASFDGTAQDADKQDKPQWKLWLDKAVGALTGVNSVVNPESEEEEEEPEKEEDKKILGLSPFWFFTILLLVVIAVIAIIVYR